MGAHSLPGVLDHLGNYRLLISFAVFTGCRVGEVLAAAWSHIDWERGQFHVRRTFREGRFQEPKTRTSYRRLSLPTFLLKELKVWRLACPNSPYDLIFSNLDGQPMSYSNLMQRGFHPPLERAGISRIRFAFRYVPDFRRSGHLIFHSFRGSQESAAPSVIRARGIRPPGSFCPSSVRQIS
jgi:integrase